MPGDEEQSLDFLSRLFGGEQKPTHKKVPPPFAEARVHADPLRCVQCGVCGYNCPVGIPVRDFARRGLVVTDPDCVQCGQCIDACPRGTLRWGRATLRTGGGQ